MLTILRHSSYDNIMSIFLVDTEAAGKTPMSGEMTEFAVVNIHNEEAFYAHLFSFSLKQGGGFVPELNLDDDGNPIIKPFIIKYSNPDTSLIGSPASEYYRNQERIDVNSLEDIFNEFQQWLNSFGQRHSAISDNPAFDLMWMNCFFDKYGSGDNKSLLGYSGRRIGDLYAGKKNKFKDHNGWKMWRKTAHTHNPVDDCLGNLQALRKIIDF